MALGVEAYGPREVGWVLWARKGLLCHRPHQPLAVSPGGGWWEQESWRLGQVGCRGMGGPVSLPEQGERSYLLETNLENIKKKPWDLSATRSPVA